MQENGVLKPAERFREQLLSMADGVDAWFAIDYAEVLQTLADAKQMELNAVSRRYGEITLRVSKGGDRTMAVSPGVGCVQGIQINCQERVCQLKH
jgi:hypothetical protein